MKFRRIQAIILLLAILFNINSYTAVRADSRIHIDKTNKTGEYSYISDTPKSVEDLKKIKNELLEDVKSAKNEEVEDFSENDTECRIIVELQGEPLIGEAINRGVSYSQLSEDIIEEATRRIEKEQGEAFLNIVEELNQEQEDDKYSADLEKLERYSANFNGFVINGDKRDLERIKENPYVKNVYLSEEYERPQLKHSNSVIGSTYAWDSLNYKGEKMVIAIIDTGVDYRHEAMRLSGDFTPKHSKNSIEEIISEYDLKGRYFTQKVPYGYNYYDHNHNLLDSYGSMHGMHVAGIAAANSETSQIKGVAPNAQILALKVFSDDVQYPTTFTDIWLKALDDAIRLKADVINMSLGAPAGILSSDGRSLQEMAISRAKKAGIAVVISAGNDGNIMSASPNQDRANSENPDTALISSPSLYHESFSVASSDNKVRYGTYLTYRASNSREYRHLINIVKGVGSQEIVSAVPIDLGNGEHEDYERHGDLTDKIIMFRIESEKFEDSNPDNNALQMQESARNKEKADDLKTERDDLKIESEKDEEELTNAEERAREEEPASDKEQISEKQRVSEEERTRDAKALNEQEPESDVKPESEEEPEKNQVSQGTQELTGDHNRDGENSHSGQESSDGETQEQDNFELIGDKSTEQSIYVEEDGDISQQAPERASQQTPHHEHDTKKMTLLEKLALAKSKNPIAIIMYNSEHHGEHLGIPLSSAFPNSDYTIAIVGNRAIKEIVQELKANPDFELTLSSVLVESINISEGKISGFSSWGPTSDLKIKPEITAPGGNIYSTAEDDGYKALSGTSMASPHVAGAVAIMKQHLQSLGVSDEQMVDEIKLRLMNTARPIMYDEYNHTFVRQQGAGLMQLDKALKTKVGVKATGGADITQDGKLELGELSQKSFDFILKLENHSEHDKSYSIAGVLIADIIQGSKLYAEPQSMNYPLFDPKEIFVEAGKTVEISYTVDFEIYDEFEENQFVEGFIFLHDQEAQEDERVDLSVPFLGFYGDWSKPLAIDAFHIPEVNLGRRRSQIFVNKDSHTVSSMFMTQVGLALPIIDNRIYFSPQSLRRHHENFYPWLGVRMAVLRNLDYVQYSILDPKTEEVLKVLGRTENVRKLSRLGSRPSFLHHPESIWDGTIQNRDIQNADRFLYEIKAALNTGSMQTQKVQTYRYMVELDSEQPQILDNESLSIEVLKGNKRKLKFKIQDSASGLKNLYLQSAYFVEKNTPKGQKENRADPDIIGETPNLERYSPRYGNYLKIEFLQSGQTSPEMGVVDRANILTITDGKLEITQEYLDLPRENPNVVYCNIGDNVRSEIEVNVVFKAQQDYVNISVNDRVLNAYTKFFRIDGSSDDYKIHFSNFYDTLSANHAVITVNDERVQDVDYQGFGKSKIKIAFPRKNAKLESLLLKYEGKTDSLIQNGEIQQEFKDLYNLTQGEFSIEFEVDKVMNGYSVFTKVSEFIPEDQMAVISFEKVDFSKLIGDKIIVIKDPERYLHIDIKKENSRFKYKKQKTHMIMLLKEEQEIAMMQLKSDQGTIYLLPAIDADEYEQMKEGYLQLKNRVFIKFDLKEDVEFSVTYDDGNFGFGTDSLKDENRQDPKDANNDQVTNGKYPIIILNNPKLLDIKRQPDLVNGKIFVDGFVGYIKDELESLKYSFVDKFGNLLSEEVEIPKSAITKEIVNFNTRHKQIYSGQAYVFGLYIKPEYFNANLRIEARSQGGERASIVRRWFFDDRFAQLAYHVQDRALSSEKASIRIRATDNSFKINLYKDDSYIDGVDLSSSSYESSDAVLEKIIEVPLQLGQNKIELKAVDLAKHESKKIIYIYRSHQ